MDGRRIRVDFSITQRAHTPTPGVYLGRQPRGKAPRSFSPRRGRRVYHDRSASPYDNYRDRYDYRNDRYDRNLRKSPSRNRYTRNRSYSRSRSPQLRKVYSSVYLIKRLSCIFSTIRSNFIALLKRLGRRLLH